MRRILSVALAAALVMASPLPSPEPTPDPPPVPEPYTFTLLGDSNSTGHSGDLPTGLANGKAWSVHAQQPGIVLVGGVALDGFTSVGLRNRAHLNPPADVLVMMLGTNDIEPNQSHTKTWSQTRSALIEAVGFSSVDDVILAAVPPRTSAQTETVDLNLRLRTLAMERGWLWVDPWSSMRTTAGGWVAGCTTDGTHATPGGYERVGIHLGRVMAVRSGQPWTGGVAESVPC